MEHLKDIWPFALGGVAVVTVWLGTEMIERRAAAKRRGRCWWCHAKDGAHARDCPTGTLRGGGEA